MNNPIRSIIPPNEDSNQSGGDKGEWPYYDEDGFMDDEERDGGGSDSDFDFDYDGGKKKGKKGSKGTPGRKPVSSIIIVVRVLRLRRNTRW